MQPSSVSPVLLLVLALALAPGATAQEVTHGSRCAPQGADQYGPGDSILFTFRPAEPPGPDLPPVLPKLPVTAYPPCVGVTLQANDVTGKAPFQYRWRTEGIDLLDVPIELSWLGNPVEVDTGTLPTGVSTITLLVSNDAGEVAKAVNLWVPELAGPLAAPTPDQAPSPDLQVVVAAQAPGAYEWQWDFGDGTVTPWSVPCDDYSTSTVSHTYSTAGTYSVVAYARNCRDGTVASEPLMITVGN